LNGSAFESAALEAAMALPLPRAHPRKRCYLRARFVFNNGYSSLDAILRDVSPAGARAAEVDMRDVPGRFDLVVAGAGGAPIRRRAKSVWRGDRMMGIAFLA
jgi:hypothetical protein